MLGCAFEGLLSCALLFRGPDAAPVSLLAPRRDIDHLHPARDVVRSRRGLALLVQGLDECAQGNLGGLCEASGTRRSRWQVIEGDHDRGGGLISWLAADHDTFEGERNPLAFLAIVCLYHGSGPADVRLH